MMRAEEKQESGFVLMELLVVISIIGILTAGIALSANDILPNYRLESQINIILSDFRKAQQRAISEQIRYGIRFDDTNNEYTIFNDDVGDIKTKTLDNGLEYSEITFGGDEEVTFIPLGTADNGHLTLRNSNNQKYEIVVSGIGRIRLEKQ
ncbi:MULTISPECIES: GspH/FimT family pseudopilin [unclassified Candidatus Frackibacter]|uniref:GspH/FimT family pseudopilin n=1 Tax=unclassified Candidatus Frackibacter TaxID=2648818 RepID=UPI0008803308|nr:MULTISPECIES: GspH/FimT family pseudopilin [unclassified Candidatus Frackibacter]SDC03560.1 Type II transport protein GspH [Candidatus Frackibacter sp. WG11]SEM68864.1 Type II transport protein GspH [Candidatus Frackibacter sp. WG12]SFL80168.1 Type II transport protein GspH [Candidatus Frackibacter sp. WG13]